MVEIHFRRSGFLLFVSKRGLFEKSPLNPQKLLWLKK